MQKMKVLLQRYAKVFEGIFLIAVSIAILVEVISISKTISPAILVDKFGDVSFIKLVAVVMIGLIGVSPMLGYDMLLNKTLNNKLNLRYLFETSWVINTINNLAGFGGFVSVGLRTEFYGKKNNNKLFAKTLTRLFMFIMSGLSIYSAIALLLVICGYANHYVQQYWIWLVGGSLYIPVVWLTSSLKKNVITKSFKLKITGISVLEWTGVVLTFFTAGWALGIPINIVQMLPILIAATIIGIASLIPGSIGSFDVIMILGLSDLGLPRETAIAWLLLYRIAYYIIPFIIGLVLLIHNFGATFSERYNDVPKQMIMTIGHGIVTVLLYFSGVMMIVYATIPNAFERWHWLSAVNPWSANLIYEFPNILLGFMLLMVARGIASKVKRALIPTVIVLLVTMVYMFVREAAYVSVTFTMVLLILVLLVRKRLFRQQFIYSWEARTVDSFIWALLVVLYIFLGVYSLPGIKHHHSHIRHHIEFILFPNAKIWLSGLLAILIVTSFVFILERYLEGHRIIVGVDYLSGKTRLANLLNQFKGNATSQLAYLGDKRLFFYQNNNGEDTVVIQFRRLNSKLLVMGDPFGNAPDFPAAMQAFIHDSDHLGYTPVFYEVSQEIAMLAHEYGYNFIKMGEEAHVDLPSFSLQGGKRRTQRTIVNRFKRDNYHFEIIKPPYSEEFLDQLNKISDQWLQGRREKGFSLGFFKRDYLQKAPIAVIVDENNKICAFASIMSSDDHCEISVDLMRFGYDAPGSTMDYMFINLFEKMQVQGYKTFNLGMAPLANVGQYYQSFSEERIANLVYQFGSNFYSFQGLRNFKSKYADSWEPRYTSYSKYNSILYVMIALLIVDNQPIDEIEIPVKFE
ncbi:phosphatidylglycerol lysyltransferase [Weissella beninensis]|uniref:Bifunctional lysylphosphatidylglycerol flippase/synthetase MprF n=1 Tax=Periweissella beninensis TaxID=504936 RepID=A0ABT0VJH3_9LACO|nr:bifunctional lysylphosphatidylglycerol flippase/synthetase MprF [Periweissella beninensis]MBM7543570.1 phosphatidylglycerol lysyltransferase [Periweissella beninensis]MCM2436552.1 bifunctional lysylphosphatidylglycerol flippase/synthetase MprF [Periweissella beninensis]